MKKLIALTLVLSAAFALYAGGGKEKSKTPAPAQPKSGAQQAAPTATPAPKPVAAPVPPPPPPEPQNPYFDGDGGKGKRLAILVPEGKNLSAAEAYLTTLVQGVFVTDLSKYSAMSVLDRQNLEKVLEETEGGIYKNAEDYIHIGEIANVGYALTGSLTKTASGFALQVQIVDTATDGSTVASYSGACTAGELDNFTGVKKASLDLLAQMEVRLTPKGREELLGAGSEQSSKAEAALAKGITSGKSGTEVQTLAYYYQAAAIDPSLAEAASRVSVMSANISSGNIGANVRNDMAWRDAWVARLTETEDFFREYNKTPPSYDLVYSTDVQTGAANYANRTVELSFGIELLPASMEWFDTMAKVVKTVKKGLEATGRSEAWGFSRRERVVTYYEVVKEFSWPGETVSSGTSPFTDQNKTFTIIAELVNEDGVTIGRQSIALAYGWTFDFVGHEGGSISWGKNAWVKPSMAINPKPLASQTVSFPAVKADLITDKLTIRIVSVDGVAAETAGKDGHIMIAAKLDYDRSPHGIAARKVYVDLAEEALYTFINGTIYDYSGREKNVVIPSTFRNGEPVTSIGKEAFRYKELTSVTIPNSVTSIGEGAFANKNLASITIPANLNFDWDTFKRYPLDQEGFKTLYDKTGRKAGTYIYDSSSRSYKYTGK
jgi:TolB-like protein